MPHSLWAVYIHLVLSTKNREPTFRDPRRRREVHAYLGGVSRQLECPPLLVGGAEDHVHILARFGRTITQATWVKELKRVPNEWMQRQGREFSRFHWQEGDSDFSVSHSNLDRVQAYIARQEEHHRKRDFQEELRALRRRHQIPYNEMYLWD